MLHLPNCIIAFRIIAIPVFVMFFKMEMFELALGTLIIASISDAFDGYFARKLGLDSDYGKLMDPLADKLLVITAFIFLTTYNIIPEWVLVIIISRELLVTSIRSIAAASKKVVSARKSGKIKTIFQMTSLILLYLYLCIVESSPIAYDALWVKILHNLGDITLYFALVLTIVSGFQYCWDNREIFKDGRLWIKKTK